MNPKSSESLFVIGISHQSAVVEVRERFALDADSRLALRDRLALERGIDDLVMLSTCNRSEIYGCSARPLNENERREIRELIFPGLSAQEVYDHRGWAAVFHFFRTSAGVDSMVVGESEILGQIKGSIEEAQGQRSPGRELSDLFRQGLNLGKRVRSETALGRGSLSVAAVAVKLARKVVGNLDGRRALILGAGETGALVSRHLIAAGVEKIVILNRTLAKAEALAEEVGGRAGILDDLGTELEASDVVMGCLEAEKPIVTTAVVSNLDPRTRCFIDISVPRSMDPKIADHAGVFAMDIDDLAALIESNRGERLSQLAEVDGIVVGETHKYLALQAFAGMTPLVVEIQDGFKSIQDEMSGGSDDRDAFSEALCRRLLGVTMSALKRSSRGQVSEDQVRMAYQAFMHREKKG
ncbi:MAG: glutamyl-tRNA reductase [Planctomycetota bacterium]